MTLPRTVAQVLKDHVTLEVEGIDRMYLNVYQPRLQTDRGVAALFRFHRGETFASSALMAPMSTAYVTAVEHFVAQGRIPLITFAKGQRKDDIAKQYHAQSHGNEGIIFVGKAQEETPVFRTEKRRNPDTGLTYPWIVRSTAMVNHYYFYGTDDDFGPFFIKSCTYFPYDAKLCINGHEYVKRQLTNEGIAFEALDNGILTCADPRRLQQLCDDLSADKIDAPLRKWLKRLPHPFTVADRLAGYRYDVSILQAESSLTQVLDRPLSGRVFFEEVIREDLDLGRPDQVQLIFQRRVTKQTPGRFRTRVLTEGVAPSLHIDSKHSRIKQYPKESRALRTETTINDTRDFGIGKRLSDLPALRRIGFDANRRLLDVQRISQDCAIGEDAFRGVNEPVDVDGRRASGLRFADVSVQALFSALLVFRLLARGFSDRDLRDCWAPLLGKSPDDMTAGQMTYHLRRLRLHGLIERMPGTHRYRVTRQGSRTLLFCTRTCNRLLRPGLAQIVPEEVLDDSVLRRGFDAFDRMLDDWIEEKRMSA
jgi:hypothetical protein